MAAVTFAAVRQRVATQIATLSGWTLSPMPWIVFGNPAAKGPARQHAHLAFAVGVPTSKHVGIRARASEGAIVATDVSVRFSARFEGLDAIDAEDACLAAELALIQAVMAQTASWPTDLKVRWDGSSRALTPTGEHWLSEIKFTVTHLLALA